MIRRILVDHARRRGFAKRGGDAHAVPLDDILLSAKTHGIDILALDQALRLLAQIDNRKSRVVELRYFGGLKIEETAGVLGISVDTAKRDWRLAKAWLFAELTRDPAVDRPNQPL
jgi:RNA polymerase sigma factor (TIGR02999 family)